MPTDPPFYDDVRLPDQFEDGMTVALDWSVLIKQRDNRIELRSLRASQPGAIINVSFPAGDNDRIEALLDLDFVVAGPYAGFRAKNPKDYLIVRDGESPQLIAVGDGVEDTFQLIRTYTVGSRSRDRIIKKVVPDTVVLAIEGTPIVEGVDYTLDDNTGLIVLDDPLPNGDELTATDGEFDYAVRLKESIPFRLGVSPTDIKTESFQLVGLILR